MTLYTWLRAQLEIYYVEIMILGIISAVFGILGVSMSSLLADLFNISPDNVLAVVAILNTIITFIVIVRVEVKSKKLRKKIETKESKIVEDKDLLKKAKSKLMEAHHLTDVIVGTKTFVLSELIVKYNEENPLSGISKDQAEAIGLYKKAMSDFDEILKQI